MGKTTGYVCCYINVVCCVGSIQIQIETEKSLCTSNTDSKVRRFECRPFVGMLYIVVCNWHPQGMEGGGGGGGAGGEVKRELFHLYMYTDLVNIYIS